MNPASIRRELALLETKRADIEAQRADASAAVDTVIAAAVGQFDPAALRMARERLANYVSRLRDIDDRTAALARVLPSAAVVEQASNDIATLHTAAAKTATEFNAAAAAFLAALAVAETAGRRLAAVRAVAEATAAAAAGVADAAGLAATLPTVPTLDAPAAALGHLQGLLCSQVAAYLVVDDVVLRELNALRAGESVAA